MTGTDRGVRNPRSTYQRRQMDAADSWLHKVSMKAVCQKSALSLII